MLSDEEIRQALRQLPGWRSEGGALVKEYVLDGGFSTSAGFVSRLAEAADEADHHPDVAIAWNRVTVTWSTHSQGGVTDRDLRMATQTDRLAGS